MKKAVRIIVNILSWIILIFALLITIIVFSSGRNNGVANLMGYIPLTVESDSMYPTFAAGDLILCKELDDYNSLKENDVITFWTIIDGKRVKNTHRIVGINQAENSRSYITRGDNNSLDDEMPAYEGDIIGQWTNVKISGFGKVMAFLRTKTGFFVCILIPMALFFLFELYKFIVTLIEVKKGDEPEPLDEEEIKRRAIEEYLAQQKAEAEAAGAPAAPAETPAAQPTEPAPAPAEQPVAPVEAPAEAVEKVETVEAEKVETVENVVAASADEAAETAETPAPEEAPAPVNVQTETVESSVETVENSVETVENPVEAPAADGPAPENAEQDSDES